MLKEISKLIVTTASFAFLLATTQALASEESRFKAIGKVIERPTDHTTRHEHELKFINLEDGETLDITDSPELLKAHCENEKNYILEVEGYRTGKFLFWGGNLVVTNFKVHEDIEVPKLAHATPESVARPFRSQNDPRY